LRSFKLSSLLKLSTYKPVLNSLLILSAGVVTFNSAFELYENKSDVKKLFLKQVNDYEKIGGSKADKYWAKKLLEGGYILHFRHAERDKWIDVQMYDALESDVHNNGKNQSRLAENDYFKDAVCLNSRGMVQAQLMGEQLKNINFPIGYVISSPSCRSRQTADIAFGGYDSLDRDLVHDGPYKELAATRNTKLLNLYLNLPMDETKNTIVSAHNSVIREGMLSNPKGKNLKLEEGGFFVLSKDNDKLYLEHRFYGFNSFIRQFHER
tara:strand:+ start:483 stop:1280 length:798 start_codon:yes stop_codon:yes gene_type:complete